MVFQGEMSLPDTLQAAATVTTHVTMPALIFQLLIYPGLQPGCALMALIAAVLYASLCVGCSWCALSGQRLSLTLFLRHAALQLLHPRCASVS